MYLKQYSLTRFYYIAFLYSLLSHKSYPVNSESGQILFTGIQIYPAEINICPCLTESTFVIVLLLLLLLLMITCTTYPVINLKFFGRLWPSTRTIPLTLLGSMQPANASNKLRQGNMRTFKSFPTKIKVNTKVMLHNSVLSRVSIRVRAAFFIQCE